MVLEDFKIFDFNNSKYGRINEDSLKEQIKNLKEKINEYGQICGEIGIKHNPNIELANISHIITSIKEENNIIYGNVDLIQSPAGKIANNIYESLNSITLRPRMVGHYVDILDEEKNPIDKELVIDNIITFDIV